LGTNGYSRHWLRCSAGCPVVIYMSDKNQLQECDVCGEFKENVHEHHIDYQKDKTIDACRACHEEIHHTEKHPELKPPQDQLNNYWETGAVDKSKIPSRPGWGISIKKVVCKKENCNQCPHGPYYYYHKRSREGVKYEYGGKVLPYMFQEQATLADYAP